MVDKFPASVARELGHYVYLYIDPRDDEIFYVGKGVRNRAFAHLNAREESPKSRRIAAIRKQGLEPRIEILVHGLPNDKTAMKVEAAAIDLIGKDKLTNLVAGFGSSKVGRMRLEQINAEYNAKDAQIKEPTMLIRINRHFRHSMSAEELYQTTRKYWKLGKKREKVVLVMAVFEGVVREVYEPAAWFSAGTTFDPEANKRLEERLIDRWEFVGRIAKEDIRKKYLYRSVQHLFKPGSQNPIVYVNVD